MDYIMAGLLFLIVIDWVMKRTVENDRNGIRRKLTTTLDDLDFADYLVILFSIWSHAEEKLNRPNLFGEKVGLKFWGKTPLRTGEREVEDVESFVYLGAKVNKQGGRKSDIKAWRGNARVAFNKLNGVWRSSLFSRKTKIKFFKTNVVILLYRLRDQRGVVKRLPAYMPKENPESLLADEGQ